MRTVWHKGVLTYERPRVMGILNVTPDSFSDGGSYVAVDSAVKHALQMADDGADIIDVGGESTRPGSSGVSAEEEIARIVPVIRELAHVLDVPISVDTMKTDVASAALDAGADIINDVNGLRAEGMPELAASAGVPAIIMHMNGMPKTMQSHPMTADMMPQIIDFLRERTDAALDAGVKEMILDPGVGFGKTAELNLRIIDNSSDFSLGYPVLIGASRKGFLSKMWPDMDRDAASIMIARRSVSSGANILRVHDVKGTVEGLKGMCGESLRRL